MDFGTILDKWEREQSQTSKTLLDNRMIFNKDAEILYKTPVPGEQRRRLRSKKPDDFLDIHGLTSEKAWLSLDLFFTRAKNCGYEKLRIIHGKGNHSQDEAVLGELVRNFIEQCVYAGESGYEKSPEGGSGATWVLLKN